MIRKADSLRSLWSLISISMVVMVAAMLTTPLWAGEFYRYIDEHGNVLFTDDLSNVPPEQREKVTAYEGSISAEPADAEGQPGPAEEQSQAIQGREQERQRLEDIGKGLDGEYEALMEQRKQLDEEKNNAVTNAHIKSYNQKILEFNAEIKAYEEKRAAYAEEVKRFNESIKNNAPGAPATDQGRP